MNFSEIIQETFAINAANFGICTLVLQKQHSSEHKIQFSQVHKHKNLVMDNSEISKPNSIWFDFLKNLDFELQAILQSTPVPPSD